MAQQSIPAVSQGVVKLPDGRAFNLESTEGAEWLDSATSFRFESSRGSKPFTARRQETRGIGYWYGSRKVEGRVHKKYIGKAEGLSIARLEEVAEGLTNVEPKKVGYGEPKAVGDNAPNRRLDALEVRLRAMEELLGKVSA